MESLALPEMIKPETSSVSHGQNVHEFLKTPVGSLIWKMARKRPYLHALIVFPPELGRDTDDVKRLSAQLTRFDVFRVSTTITCLEDGDGDADASLETISMPLVSLATKDTATHDITTDLESAEERGKQNLVANVQQRLIEGTVKFHDTMKRHNSKTFAHLYKAHVSSTTKVQKTIKADRKLLQRLLNVVNAGRVINMLDILKHELSPVPLSLAKAGGDMNATPKAELLNILSANVDSPSTVPRH